MTSNEWDGNNLKKQQDDFVCSSDHGGTVSFGSRAPSPYGRTCSDWSDQGTLTGKDDEESGDSPIKIFPTPWSLQQPCPQGIDHELDGRDLVLKTKANGRALSPAEVTTTSSAPPLLSSAFEEDKKKHFSSPRAKARTSPRGGQASSEKQLAAPHSSIRTDGEDCGGSLCTVSSRSLSLSHAADHGLNGLHTEENHITERRESPITCQSAHGRPVIPSGAATIGFDDDSQSFADELQRSFAQACRAAEATFFNTKTSIQRRMIEQFRFEQEHYQQRLQESRAEAAAARAELAGMRSAKEATEDQLARVFAYVRRRLLRQQGRARVDTTFNAWLTFVERAKARRQLLRVLDSQQERRRLRRAFLPWRTQSFQSRSERLQQQAAQAAQQAADRLIATLQTERRTETQLLIETRQQLRQEVFKSEQLQKTLQIFFLQGVTPSYAVPTRGRSEFSFNTCLLEAPVPDNDLAAPGQSPLLFQPVLASRGRAVSSSATPLSSHTVAGSHATEPNSRAAGEVLLLPSIGAHASNGSHLASSRPAPAASSAVSTPAPRAERQHCGGIDGASQHLQTATDVTAAHAAASHPVSPSFLRAAGAHRCALFSTDAPKDKQACIQSPWLRTLQPAENCGLAVIGRKVRSACSPRGAQSCRAAMRHTSPGRAFQSSNVGRSGTALQSMHAELAGHQLATTNAALQGGSQQNCSHMPHLAFVGFDDEQKLPHNLSVVAQARQAQYIASPNQFYGGGVTAEPLVMSGVPVALATCGQGMDTSSMRGSPDASNVHLGGNHGIAGSQRQQGCWAVPGGQHPWCSAHEVQQTRYQKVRSCNGAAFNVLGAHVPAKMNRRATPQPRKASLTEKEGLAQAQPVASHITESRFGVTPLGTYGVRPANLRNKRPEYSPSLAGKDKDMPSTRNKKEASWRRSPMMAGCPSVHVSENGGVPDTGRA